MSLSSGHRHFLAALSSTPIASISTENLPPVIGTNYYYYYYYGARGGAVG
jgi:hypothetical protein